METGTLILLIVWATGIIPSWIWIRKNTNIDRIGCSIMSIGSWGLVVLWIADKIYQALIKKLKKDNGFE